MASRVSRTGGEWSQASRLGRVESSDGKSYVWVEVNRARLVGLALFRFGATRGVVMTAPGTEVR